MKKTYLCILLLLMTVCMTNCGTYMGESTDVSTDISQSISTMTSTTSTTISTTLSLDITISDVSSDIVPDISDLEFSDLAGLEFWFGSGAGGWCTIVEIKADGTFSGYYHDSEAGSIGNDYPNGTLYECYFSGKFSPLLKIGEYEYSMKCELLEAEGTAGEEKIIDGVKIITSEPHGFDNADDFRLYLPGKKTSELSEEFLNWTHGTSVDGILVYYGLYNVGGEQGFTASVE